MTILTVSIVVEVILAILILGEINTIYVKKVAIKNNDTEALEAIHQKEMIKQSNLFSAIIIDFITGISFIVLLIIDILHKLIKRA